MGKSPKIIEVRKSLFVDPRPIDNEACTRDINDPTSAFAQYMLPRLKASQDEASKEVLALMEDGEGVGEAVALVIQSMPAPKTKKLRTWADEAIGSNVYAYAEIHGPRYDGDRTIVATGLMLTEGGPRDKILYSSMAHQNRIINHAAYRSDVDLDVWIHLTRGSYAVAPPERKIVVAASSRQDLRKHRMIEFTSKEQYDDVLALTRMSGSAWKGPGIYDVDKKLSYVGTVAEYVQTADREAAETEIHSLLAGYHASEIKTACERIRSRT
jgi:hypothetical protein